MLSESFHKVEKWTIESLYEMNCPCRTTCKITLLTPVYEGAFGLFSATHADV